MSDPKPVTQLDHRKRRPPTVDTPHTPETDRRRPVLFTVEQAARQLSIGRTNMYALIRDGHIRTVQIGQLRRVPAAALTEYVNRLTRNQAA